MNQSVAIAPLGRAAYHFVVELFDARSGTRIDDADVAAAVGPVDLEGFPRKLDRMQAGGVSYGGYFRIGAPGPHRIRFEVRRPGWHDPTIVQAHYRVEAGPNQ